MSQLELFAEVSPVSPGALPESNEAWMTRVTSGRRWLGLCKSSSPVGWLVRTCLASSSLGSTRCSLIWRVSATKCGRLVFRLRPSTRHTSESGFGLLPTVRASDGERGGRGDLIQAVRGNRNSHFKLWPTPTAMTNTGGAAMCKWGGAGARARLREMTTPQELNGALNPEFVEWLMGYPIGWTDCGDSETP